MTSSTAKQEQAIIKRWKSIEAFEQSVMRRSRGKRFVFFEGPPTANGRPGIHHVEARSFKDVILRWKTMRGFRVERKAGWDTHGLPVELEVERQLGLANKKDIERYGIEKFNEASRRSVWKYTKDWEVLTERMGFWIDMKDPYITYDPLYMETLWWIIARAHKKGLLYEGYRVVPYCPRCETAISSHEVAQGYEDVTDISVYVKFKIKNPADHNLPPNTFFLAWTTTPWTLPGNVALAVGGDITYVVLHIKGTDERYIVAKDRVSDVIDGAYDITEEISGNELEGIEYEPVFNSLKDTKEKKYYVASADFVTTEEGTGIVHTAVMYGEDDYNLGERLALPKVHTVDKDGTFNDRVPQWRGMFVKDAEEGIRNDLRARGLLYAQKQYRHAYPFCWRCQTPLIYYADTVWLLAMRTLRAKLIAHNKKINWVPSHLKDGRFGEWLREVKDWTLSRSRYWGTPLPIWRCGACGAVEAIGSRGDLRKKRFGTNTYYLMRHGESTKNGVNIIVSSYEAGEKHPLTSEGERQARAAARDFKKQGGIDVVVSSDILRARQTAEIVGKELGIPVLYDKDLREYHLGKALEGKDAGVFYDAFPTVADRFAKKPRGGETLAHVQRRMARAVSRIEKTHHGKRILIVSHGDPLWVLESAADGLTVADAARRRTKNYPRVGEVKQFVWRVFPYAKNGELDLHRPYVDRITFSCTACKEGIMRRVEEIMDVWFDSGAMPFAQWHYPFEHKAYIDAEERFPADYIVEAVDQTRGWFYTLLAISTILGKGAPYRNVISLGHVLDERGKKMSKSRGNIVEPMDLMDRFSADALRWYFFTVNEPGDSKRFQERDIRDRNNKYIGTLENTLAFYKTYRTRPNASYRGRGQHVLDRWIGAKLARTQHTIGTALDSYDVVGAARALDSFVTSDLSNWYVRRSRRRFQKPKNKQEQQEAAAALAYVLLEIARWTAPFTPFIAEYIYQEITGNKKASVHWEAISSPRASGKDDALLHTMEEVRTIAAEGLRLRSEAGIRVRQPLQRIEIRDQKPEIEGNNDLLALIQEEVNVKEAVFGVKIKEKYALDTKRTPELLREGLMREFVRNIQDLRKSGGLKPHHVITVRYRMNGEDLAGLENSIAQETGAKTVQERHGARERFLGESTFVWEGKDVWIGIKKA